MCFDCLGLCRASSARLVVYTPGDYGWFFNSCNNIASACVSDIVANVQPKRFGYVGKARSQKNCSYITRVPWVHNTVYNVCPACSQIHPIEEQTVWESFCITRIPPELLYHKRPRNYQWFMHSWMTASATKTSPYTRYTDAHE